MYDLPKENIQKDCKKVKRIEHSPLSPGMQEHVPKHREKVRKSCKKNIQIVHCVIKLLGHLVHPFWKSAEILGYCWTANNIIVQWLRLQTLMKWSPYPLQTYTKCWIAFPWCEWAPGLIIMSLKPHLSELYLCHNNPTTRSSYVGNLMKSWVSSVLQTTPLYRGWV